MPHDARVIVAGSGPAGLSAALYLSENGIDTLVVERLSASYPKYHSVCGAGISEAAFGELEYIVPDCIRDHIGRTELVFPGGTVITMKVRGYVLDRVAFLQALRKRCEDKGCRFVNAEISSVERTDDGFTVHTSAGDLSSEYLLGCDGAHSVVRRDLFGTRPEMIPVDEFITDDDPEPVFRITLGERYRGLYEWYFPAGDRSSIGTGKGILKPETYIHKGSRHIPFGGVPKISDGKASICGDAAGMANPISGGGLRAAMVSGQNAAKEIIGGTAGTYQRWWDRSILSSPRFMGFRRTLLSWTDDDYIKVSRMLRNGRNVYIWGFLSGLLHPKYVPVYIGCLKTFKHTW